MQPNSNNETNKVLFRNFKHWRVKAGVIVIGFAALVTAIQNADLAINALDHGEILRDDPNVWQQRVEPLMKALPASGSIGYLSDRNLTGQDYFDTFQETLEFIWSQYALAPRILIPDSIYPIDIGVLTQPPARFAYNGHSLEITNDFGYRFYLIGESSR